MGLTVPDGLMEGLAVTVGLLVAAERVAVTVGVIGADCEADTVTVAETERDCDDVGVADHVYDAMAEAEGLIDTVALLLGLPVVETDCVADTVAVAEGITQAPAGSAMSIGPMAVKSSTA